MFIRNSRFSLRRLFALLAVAFLTGCSSGGGGFPRIANPPAFDYADGAQLRSQMHQLAFQLQQLDMTLAADRERDRNSRDEVINHLRNIERIGNDLREGDMSRNHIFLRNDMATFLSTVNRARMSAENNPPNYYMAGRVSGACVNCHQVSR